MDFKKIVSLIAIFGLSVSTAAIVKPQNHSQKQQQPQQETVDKKPPNLREAIGGAGSQIRGFNGTWITDTEFYYTATDRSIHKYNAALGTDTIFLTSNFLNTYSSGSSFRLSPDTSKILVRYDAEEIFRHSSIARYDVFDIARQTTVKIHNGEKLQNCAWSPVNNRLAYEYNNNVYIHFGENSEIQLTTDGINGVVYNGIADWVYEEEVLGSASAIWWSKDGSFLAVGVFNDSQVETFKYFVYGEAEDPQFQYPKEMDLKYPKPGTSNPIVTLRVFDLNADTKYVSIKAPVKVVSSDHILQNVAWTADRQLLITWLNRRQNVASLQLCSVAGECRELKRVEEPNGWITMGKPMCLKASQNCLFTYWLNNWYQVWNLNLQTGENLWQSRGNFTVLKLYGYDGINNKLYYQATLGGDPSANHVFSNDDCLTCNLTDHEGEKCLSAGAYFSKAYSYYSVTCNGPNPSYTKIFETKTNTEVKDWESNAAFRAKWSKQPRPKIEIMKITLADGSMGMAKLQFPPNLNINKKYPMIIRVYGGPNSVQVTNSFSAGFDQYMVTNREVIYVQIDGRGTGNKGKDLLFSVNNHLGEFEVEDQIHVAKYLQNKFPFVDKDRCGIWGWSYGGYMAARVLANDTNEVFRCGISVAPVTFWLYYDSIYTERFMDLPAKNMKKYLDTSVLHQVDNFRNHDFLLIHGTADDNVHSQNSMMLAKVLQANDILFEEMIYPDENHSISRLSSHLYNTMEDFWVKCLNLTIKNEVA